MANSPTPRARRNHLAANSRELQDFAAVSQDADLRLGAIFNHQGSVEHQKHIETRYTNDWILSGTFRNYHVCVRMLLGIKWYQCYLWFRSLWMLWVAMTCTMSFRLSLAASAAALSSGTALLAFWVLAWHGVVGVQTFRHISVSACLSSVFKVRIPFQPVQQAVQLALG